MAAMRTHNFEAGKQVETPSEPGKPEWSDELLIAIPSRAKAFQLVYEILAQLEDEDDGCSGVCVVLHGELF